MKKNSAVIFLLFVLFGCTAEYLVESTFQYSGKGTVRLAVGTYSIQSDDGYNFIPENLGPDYKINGLRVEFSGTVKIERRTV